MALKKLPDHLWSRPRGSQLSPKQTFRPSHLLCSCANAAIFGVKLDVILNILLDNVNDIAAYKAKLNEISVDAFQSTCTYFKCVNHFAVSRSGKRLMHLRRYVNVAFFIDF